MKQSVIILVCLLTYTLAFSQPKQEVRAVWIATNFRIDWPSKAFMNSDDINKQQDEFINMLDKLKEANMNMVFLQTRFRGEVIYRSNIEPMSSYIAGVENTWSKYDPLKFAIEECHKRGIECHAWFVAYNAGAKDHVSSTATKQSELLKPGKREYWFDPGNPATNTYLLSVIKEIVAGYDIDGFHLDYIRYPAEQEDFPDEDTYKRYGKGMPKDDWRRHNINRFVSEVYDTIKARKPWVQVSCAVVPFYKKLAQVQRSHWTAYDDAHQDPEKWMADGKVDFIVPMIYNKDDLFRPAVEDWATRCYDRHVIPGIGAYLLNEKERGGNWTLKNITDQVEYARNNHSVGQCFYSAKFLVNNKKGLLSELKKNYYKHPALLPPMKTEKAVRLPVPNSPKAMFAGEYLYISWEEQAPNPAHRLYYNVYRSKTSPVDTSNPANLIGARIDGNALFLPAEKGAYYYTITTYDRYHNESAPSKELFFNGGN